MPDNVARSIMGAHGEGKKQHADFVAHRLQSRAVAFNAPIKINKIHLPGNRHKNRNKSKHVDSTKEDMLLLGQIYMTCSMYTVSQSIACYCDYTIVIIVLHIHTRASTGCSCNDPVAFMLTTVIPNTVWRHF